MGRWKDGVARASGEGGNGVTEAPRPIRGARAGGPSELLDSLMGLVLVIGVSRRGP